MTSPFFGEFMGTLVLLLLGNGVVAGVVLKKSKSEGAGWIVITAGWCFAVIAGVFTATACGSRDAHLNPAVTLGMAAATGDCSKLIPYVLAQMSGAFAGAAWSGCIFCRIGKRRPTPRRSSRCSARRRRSGIPPLISSARSSAR